MSLQIAFESFHNNQKLVRGHLSRFYIGNIVEEERELSEINKDFLRLREELIQKVTDINIYYFYCFLILGIF